MLEDESGRIKLIGPVITSASNCIVTGCVIGVLGVEQSSGEFEVLDLRFAEYAPQKPLPTPRSENESKQGPCYLAIVSGLSIKGSAYEGYSLQLLKEYLTGEIGGEDESQESSKIVQLIIAGNSLDVDDENASGNSAVAADGGASFTSALLPSAVQLAQAPKKKSKPVKYGYDRSKFHPEPMQHLDQFVADIVTTVPVSVMPGTTDLANVSLPQQPIHPALFQKSRRLNSGSEKPVFESMSNPSWWELRSPSTEGAVSVFGSSGQPIDDMYKYLPDEDVDRLDLLNQTLRWQHAAPTAPDTLTAYSFYDKDPFVLAETPHVYFAGNQPRFDTRLVQGTDEKGGDITVRLICVPDFSATGELVLVDLSSSTFETTAVRFG